MVRADGSGEQRKKARTLPPGPSRWSS